MKLDITITILNCQKLNGEVVYDIILKTPIQRWLHSSSILATCTTEAQGFGYRKKYLAG
jgi:hypothetical protein